MAYNSEMRFYQRPAVQITVAIVGAVGAIIAALITILPWLMADNSGSGTNPGGGSPKEDLPRANVLVRKVVVAEKNSSGKEWDDHNSKPDPYVHIYNVTSGQTVKTSHGDNTFEKEWNTQTVRVSAGDTLQITVYDHDHLNLDDVIGRITRQVTNRDIQAGKVILEKFDQVISLELGLEK